MLANLVSMLVDSSGHFWIRVDVWGVCCTLDLDAGAGVELQEASCAASRQK